CSSSAGNPETQAPRGRPRPPNQNRELTRRYQTCALVGNGPGVREVANGEAIDAHDAVFRFNTLQNTAGKNGTDPFIGNKVSFRMFNKKRIATLGRLGFVPADNEAWLFWNYAAFPMLGRVANINKVNASAGGGLRAPIG
ncbi:hypothetical protein CYMTET_33293, partial [Cymbomonas tetramitiformis]